MANLKFLLICLMLLLFKVTISREALSGEIIHLLKGLDTNEYYAGPLYFYNIEIIYFSDFEHHTFYEINQWNSMHPEYRKLILKNKNGKNLNYGYLWRTNNELFVIDWENLYKYKLDGSLLIQIPTNMKRNSVKYITDFMSSPFKISASNDFLFPVSVNNQRRFKGAQKRIFSRANRLAALNCNGKVIKYFGSYTELFQTKIFSSIYKNSYCSDSISLYILDPVNLMISQYNLSDASLINKIQLKYNVKVPAGFTNANMDYKNQEKVFKQKIESSNVSDIFKWKNNFYLLYAEPITDTCVVGEVLSRSKKGCYIPSFKERNQWILYYHKPVYLIKFDESGTYISKQLIDQYNSCELLKVNENIAYIYSRSSIRGGAKIVKVNLE